MTFDWFLVFFWLLTSFCFASLLFFIGFFLVYKPIDFEKITSYECGFNPFEDVYGRFDVRFYLVAILFIIFDIEVSFLFPWSLVLYELRFLGLFSMLIFLAILTLGFFYEWRRGALDW